MSSFSYIFENVLILDKSGYQPLLIKTIQDELTLFIPSCTPATEYHLGLLKAKLAKYRAQLLEPSKTAGAKGEGFDVMKSGDARVALIGFPSVGKVGGHQRLGRWTRTMHHEILDFKIVKLQK